MLFIEVYFGKIWNVNVKGEFIKVFIFLMLNKRKYGSNGIIVYIIWMKLWKLRYLYLKDY